MKNALGRYFDKGTPSARKAAWIWLTISWLYLPLMLGLMVMAYMEDGRWHLYMVLPSLAALVSAALSIYQAIDLLRSTKREEDLQKTLMQVESLYGRLRTQRHEFLNQLQIVYGLMSMEEYKEASRYIESIYADIQQVSGSLRTAHPAINALLAAKRADAEGRGIELRLAIRSPWTNLPIPSWEVCRLFGNLIDNAFTALEEHSGAGVKRWVEVTMEEEARRLTFSVTNNGPQIPEQVRARIFEPGFTTRPNRGDGRGQGMGLSIVCGIMREGGGELSVDTNEERTRFEGWFPRPTAAEAAETGAPPHE